MESGYAGFFESSLVRLFPNREGIEYRGKVHELAEHSIRELGRFEIKHSPIRIHHYGHTEAVRKTKNKGNLYTPLGEAKVAENPADWKNQFELGVEHNNNGRLTESETAFILSAELNPAYLPTHINLGYVQCELKKYPQAVETLKRALALNPRSEEAYCNLGVIFMRLPDLPRAEQALRRAIACSPSYVNAYNNLAITLANMGRLSEAAQILCRIRELFSGHSAVDEKLAELYSAVGQPEVAQRYRTNSQQSPR
jgi:Flp pilus assembly protein TadD